ncbi:Oligoribonuclease NrnB or cAMP/cGMP phosphodiesterase, DHH superfamily [Bacillus sp. OV322]|uniref:DHH family phosphoesterase n=1 Tax=Bacillus sp. OV322 TaxID=1882764 RepID=UPI0008ED5256|nr:oligoribonuclease [Bacillus sp. OV322]SFC86616.1 Oligoribonuclease NrnB or cAMP/cGMP phosphodiesterase, DHH superfamily [Bacillus sp. OV322]
MYRVLTHNDLDGVGCGILAKLAFGDSVQVIYNSISALNYQVEKFIQEGNKDVRLLITDLSVHADNEKRITEFVESGGHAELIDHHQSAQHLNEHSWAAVTVVQEDGKQTSATSLLYEKFLKDNLLERSQILDKFVEQVRQYDTWEWELNENIAAKQLNDLLFMITIEEFEEKILKKLTSESEFVFDEMECKLLDVEERRVQRYINRKKREVYQASIGGKYAGIVHAESYHSELGNELSKEFPHLDYIAIIMVGSKRISLRTIHDEVDVSEVAAKYDGGGHRKASGCNLTEEAYKKYVEGTFFSEPLKRDAFKNQFNLKESERGSLYMGKNDERLFVFFTEDKGWSLEINHQHNKQFFSGFPEMEKHIKRKYYASLTRDDKYLDYLIKNYQMNTGKNL